MELIFCLSKREWGDSKIINIVKQKIEIEEALKNKIEFICSFCNTTPTIFNGSIRTIEHTNLTYV